jgi:phage host-nuclease inhibitor protein Gam
MDIETAEALDTLRSDIHRVEREVVRVETSLNSKIERVEASLTATMYELNEDAKRHTDVRLESMHDDIRMIAEHVVALSSKVDSLRR